MLAVSMMTPVTAVAQTAEVTFTKDVASILQRSCQTCHRDGSIAPMSLLTYEEARPWARAIKEKVETRSMPPWYIDKNIGVQGFKYDRSLSDAEIATGESGNPRPPGLGAPLAPRAWNQLHNPVSRRRSRG